MTPEKQREIARMGGRAAHALGKGHEFTAEEARVAGAKGGIEVQKRLREARLAKQRQGDQP